MSGVPAICASGITKIFRDRKNAAVTVLDHVNLTVARGQITALIGPDNAGKTTFLRLACGLMTPTEGNLSVLGLDIRQSPQDVQALLSYMPQRFALYEDLTCMENLNLYAELYGVPLKERLSRFEMLLDITGLAPFTKRLAGKLSGGMKQKLALACTLVRSPQLLLLDEPTVGVDPLSRRELWKILRRLSSEERISSLISTTYLEEAELCQYIYILHHGHILGEGVPNTLAATAVGRCFLAEPPNSVSARILQAALLDDSENVIDAVPYGGKVRFSLRSPECLASLRVRKIFPRVAITPTLPRLEDSFMILLHKATKQGEQPPPFVFDYTAARQHAAITAIDVKEIVRRFGNFIAVNNTTFQVQQGEIFGLLGPNGAGKTTTFRMLCGLLPASSGSLAVGGVDLRSARAQARAKIGYVAQRFSLYGELSVWENLEFFGSVYGLHNPQLRKRMTTMINQFGLKGVEDIAAEKLSTGYKQRLSMAAALLHQPSILFLDEPTSGIDPLARRAFWRQVTALAAEGTTIVVTTHFMEEAEYCDRIMIQDQGKMLILGTPAEVRCAGGESESMNQAFIAIVERSRTPQNRKEVEGM